MSTDTPMIFRPSAFQRSLALLLCAGSWLVGTRALASLIQQMPRLHVAIVEARAAGEDPWLAWTLMTLAIAAVVVGGILLLTSIIGLVLIEGTHVIVDQLGITVDLAYLPGPLARRLGAGRIPWKRVGSLQHGGPFFVILGNGGSPEQKVREEPLPPLRFLVVEELERLVNHILERSPNISLKD